MAEVFFDNGKTREFKKSRGNFGWQIFTRNVFVTLFLSVLVVVPTVFGLRAYVGEKDWKKVENKFDAVIGPAFHRIDTRPKVASNTVPVKPGKPAKKSKRGNHR